MFQKGDDNKNLVVSNKAVTNSQTFFKPLLQPKLTINEPDDEYERQADAVAEHVMRMKGNEQSFFSPKAFTISSLQRKENFLQEINAANSIESYLNKSNSNGRNLDHSTRDFFEPKFGYDFSEVRIHNDDNAAKSAQSINALAYTVGNDIVFNTDQFSPCSGNGKKLLAHELTHVVQQRKSAVSSKVQRDVGWARSASGKPYGDPLTQDVNEKVKETISNAPEKYKQWNLSTSWHSKFQVVYDLNTNTVTAIVKLHTTADAATKAAWEKAIEDKWSKKYKIQVLNPEGKETSRKDILIDVQWVDKAKDAHYTIHPTKAGDTRDGRAGVSGTTSMTDWGVKDTTDITHEFGHMLGNTEEYFTTNSVDYSEGGKKRGFRDKGSGIMNNPSEDPAPRHYEAIRKAVVTLVGADDKNIKVI